MRKEIETDLTTGDFAVIAYALGHLTGNAKPGQVGQVHKRVMTVMLKLEELRKQLGLSVESDQGPLNELRNYLQ